METKICTKCGRELPVDQFNWRSKAKGTRRADCKDCHNGYMKEKYREKKLEIQDLKQGLKCAKCGYDRCGAALDFHHINPEEKEFTIGKHRSKSKENLLKEISKCVCLCANCHRKIHAGLINLEDYLK